MAIPTAVEINDGGSGWVSTTGGVNVTPGNTISIRLQYTDGVSQWALQVFGVDEVTAIAPTLNGVDPDTHIVSDPTTVVTFDMPSGTGIGRALIFRSTVNATAVSSFGLYTLTTQGLRVAAVGERFEGDPDFGWAVTVNAIIRAGGGGGGGLPPLSGDQYAVLMEDPGGVLQFARLTEEMILPAFSIASFGKTNPSGGTLLFRRGTTLSSISAVASYTSGPPSVATISNAFGGSSDAGDINPGSWGLSGPNYTNGNLSGSVKRNGADNGADPTMTATLTATKGTAKTASFTVRWTSDVWWGTDDAGISTESEVKSLSGNALAISSGRTFEVSPANEKVYYAIPVAYGTVAFSLNGFPAAFNDPLELGITNVNGVTRIYYLYESTNLLTGTNLSFFATSTA